MEDAEHLQAAQVVQPVSREKHVPCLSIHSLPPRSIFLKLQLQNLYSQATEKASNSSLMSNVVHEMIPWTTGVELKLGVVSIFLYKMLNTGLVGWDGGVKNSGVRDLLHFFMKTTKFLGGAHTTFSIQSPIFCKSKPFT